RSGNSLLSIINDILDFSKLDAGMGELESISFDLERVCQESMELIASNATGKGLELVFDYAPECPRHIMGDPSRLRQVLLNLVGNAVKFTDKGYIRLGVSPLTLKSGVQQLCIEVQDTGIGLKPEAIQNLFDEFTQADASTTRNYGGTGLGLAISKKIVELMGTKIEVESKFGEGTTFRFIASFPVAESPRPLSEVSLTGLRVLLVDNSLENRRIFKKQLEHMELRPTIVSSLKYVVESLLEADRAGDPYKLVIIGHNLPDFNGLKLGLEIRQHAEFDSLKLLIFPVAGLKGDAELFYKAGFDAYLTQLSRYETIHGILAAMLNHQTGQPIITQHSIKDRLLLDVNDEVTFNATILVVEDVLANQLISRKFLETMGVKVDIANNGQEAIDAYKNREYDLIFMDCRMPVMDGYQATKAIRLLERDNNKKPMPIIALTANASSDDRLFCEQAGMDDVITKPFKRSDLSNSLCKWLASSVTSNVTVEDQPELDIQASQRLDEAVLMRLKNDMGDDFREVIDSTISSIEGYLDDFTSMTDETPADDLIRWAHTLKSLAANLGAIQLTELARELELELKGVKDINKDIALPEAVSLLQKEYQIVLNWLKLLTV
ncbi:MAG: response regulator, partial [Gammaproteobacteria bacterium]|nr:response regulator [Gammaproteobacteria bacterium]